MRLTDVFLRKVKPTDKVQKHSDGGGLFLQVTPAGGKLWRMAYRFGGKQKMLSFGVYPHVSLKDARQKRDEAKSQLAAGIDPSLHKKAVKAAAKIAGKNTFEAVAREWIDKRKGFWSASHGVRTLAILENDIFSAIGTKPIKQITAPELLTELRKIEGRGAIDAAHRTLQVCGTVFRYAIATGRAERDTAADLRGALSPVKSGNFASITDPKTIGILLRDIDECSGHFIVTAALRMVPYVFVRPSELRNAEWSEFDFAKREWRIPAARMKMKQPHIVPLSKQVLSILEDLQRYTGHTPFLFSSQHKNSAPICDSTFLRALRRLGYAKEQMSIHGFRSMASTLLNEQGYNRDWIERQLAHSERNSIRAAYNYAEYLPERRAMMQEWADYLDSLKTQKD